MRIQNRPLCGKVKGGLSRLLIVVRVLRTLSCRSWGWHDLLMQIDDVTLVGPLFSHFLLHTHAEVIISSVLMLGAVFLLPIGTCPRSHSYSQCMPAIYSYTVAHTPPSEDVRNSNGYRPQLSIVTIALNERMLWSNMYACIHFTSVIGIACLLFLSSSWNNATHKALTVCSIL